MSESEELRRKLHARDIALARINTHGALTENDQHMIDIAREQMPDLDDAEKEAVQQWFAEQFAAQESETGDKE